MSALKNIDGEYLIPMDVLMDIAFIIERESIPHRIQGVKRSKQSVLIELNFTSFNTKAKENIEQILTDYQHYRYGNETAENQED